MKSLPKSRSLRLGISSWISCVLLFAVVLFFLKTLILPISTMVQPLAIITTLLCLSMLVTAILAVIFGHIEWIKSQPKSKSALIGLILGYLGISTVFVVFFYMNLILIASFI